MNVNDYMNKQYVLPPCWELVSDIYAKELGDNPLAYKTVNRSIRELSSAFRLAIHKSPHGFQQVQEPEDFTIVLMGRSERLGVTHCGVYYAGKVLHAADTITLYEDLSTIKDTYKLVEYWARP